MSLVLLGILNSQASGAAAGAVELVEKVTLASTGSVTFTGLSSQPYEYYELVGSARTAGDYGYYVPMTMRLNNDSGSNYGFDRWYRNGTASIRGDAYANQTSFQLYDIVPGARSGKALFTIDFFNAQNTSSHIGWTYTANGVQDGSTESNEISDGGGIYRPSTISALNEIDLTVTNNFQAGSEFWLYGYRTA